MLDGIDAIDWSAMDHAYGPATEVPDWLRDLTSHDAETREYALDAMYGAVHHQGDVYDCTLATIPFLLAMVREPSVPDRAHIVTLLASYAGREPGSAERYEPEPGSEYAAAEAAISAAWDDFAALLTDPDPAVRAAAPLALSADAVHDTETAQLLLNHYPFETDTEPRLAMLETLGLYAAHPGFPEVFAQMAAIAPDPQTRIAALTAALGGEGVEPPSGLVDTAVSTMLDLYGAAPPQRPAEDRPATDTLIGAIRQANAGRSHPDLYPLLLKLFRGFGDRPDDQNRLLTRLLRSDSWEARLDAIGPATMFVATWRGDHRELIGLIGEQLGSDRPRLRERAAAALNGFEELAAPAADELARAVATAPREAASSIAEPEIPWLTVWEGETPSLGPALRALARVRDPRAVPALAWVLEQPLLPTGIGHSIAWLGAAATELIPSLRQRITDPELSEDLVVPLAHALRHLDADRHTAATALVSREPTVPVLLALSELGPDVAEVAEPHVRARLTVEDERVRAAAAYALWRLTGDTAGVAELAGNLAGGRYQARDAADWLGEIGPDAAAAVPGLRRLLAAEREQHPWPQLAAAIALWRITGETGPTLTTLLELWPEYRHMRPVIAKRLADMGSGAESALDLVLGELASRHRYHVEPGIDHSSSHLLESDERLLRDCRTVAARFGH